MLHLKTIIKRFATQGEKTGWSYVHLSNEQANQLKPGNRASFRITGKIDDYAVEKMAVMPMGDGSFIIPLNATIRKALRKQKDAEVTLRIAADDEPIKINADLMECLSDEPAALKHFEKLTKGHQNYFSSWIETAKTESTKAKRIAMAVGALQKGWGFPEMLRANKKERQHGL